MAQNQVEDQQQQIQNIEDTKLVDNLSQEQLEELREAFDLFDKDGSKSISKDELRHVFKAMGQDYSDEELTKMVKGADRDGNAEISFFEFCVLMAGNIKQPEKKDEYAEAFKVFDRLANGTVDTVELVQAMTNVGRQREEECGEDTQSAEQIKNRTQDIIQFLEGE